MKTASRECLLKPQTPYWFGYQSEENASIYSSNIIVYVVTENRSCKYMYIPVVKTVFQISLVGCEKCRDKI